MNEASSKYVDQIATEKLIQEKLSQVRHSTPAVFHLDLADLVDFSQLPGLPHVVSEQQQANSIMSWSFQSALPTAYPENNQVHCLGYLAKRSGWEYPARGALVFIHGLYEDNLEIYNFFITQLNGQGMDVYLMLLPYHYLRTPAASAFSGEYFWSGDLVRSAWAYKQAIYDLYQLQQWVSQRSGQPAWIVGFSLGGGVALTLAGLARLPGVFSINPVCNISRLVWTSPLFAPIQRDLEGSGISLETVKTVYMAFEPLNAAPILTDMDHIVLGRSLYDQINDVSHYGLLVDTWNLRHVIDYKAGHLNVLRAPRLAMDVTGFALRDQ
jgi:pimeloyl-ACP methyl ester carboxylesterase